MEINLTKGRNLFSLFKSIKNVPRETILFALEATSINTEIRAIEEEYSKTVAGSEKEKVVREKWFTKLSSFYKNGVSKFVHSDVKPENVVNYIATQMKSLELYEKLDTVDALSRAHGESDPRNIPLGNFVLLLWANAENDISGLSKAYLTIPNDEESLYLKKFILTKILELSK